MVTLNEILNKLFCSIHHKAYLEAKQKYSPLNRKELFDKNSCKMKIKHILDLLGKKMGIDVQMLHDMCNLSHQLGVNYFVVKNPFYFSKSFIVDAHEFLRENKFRLKKMCESIVETATYAQHLVHFV